MQISKVKREQKGKITSPSSKPQFLHVFNHYLLKRDVQKLPESICWHFAAHFHAQIKAGNSTPENLEMSEKWTMRQKFPTKIRI
jgi:hypothetical protein